MLLQFLYTHFDGKLFVSIKLTSRKATRARTSSQWYDSYNDSREISSNGRFRNGECFQLVINKVPDVFREIHRDERAR